MEADVPVALRRWFVFHFVADWLFALPLFFFPVPFLTALGWVAVDPVTARAVAAALVGIGTQSLLDRGAGRQIYLTMLSLKVIWSACASIGLLWSALSGGPPMVWGFLGTFVAFNTLWTYWLVRLRRQGSAG
jgi:hypothetical protein